MVYESAVTKMADQAAEEMESGASLFASHTSLGMKLNADISVDKGLFHCSDCVQLHLDLGFLTFPPPSPLSLSFSPLSFSPLIFLPLSLLRLQFSGFVQAGGKGCPLVSEVLGV